MALRDSIESFITGFGAKSEIDINNAVFIATRLLNFKISLEFRDGGRLGIESLELYSLFDEIPQGGRTDKKACSAGQNLSQFDSTELRLMASFLWNEGKSSLFEEEREKAKNLLEHFRVS